MANPMRGEVEVVLVSHLVSNGPLCSSPVGKKTQDLDISSSMQMKVNLVHVKIEKL